MYTATFTFAKHQFDDAFHALDAVIARVAKSIPGYLGEEAWENPPSGLVSTVYYWESMDALQQLMKHPAHIEAKARQGEWPLHTPTRLTAPTHITWCARAARWSARLSSNFVSGSSKRRKRSMRSE